MSTWRHVLACGHVVLSHRMLVSVRCQECGGTSVKRVISRSNVPDDYEESETMKARIVKVVSYSGERAMVDTDRGRFEVPVNTAKLFEAGGEAFCKRLHLVL